MKYKQNKHLKKNSYQNLRVPLVLLSLSLIFFSAFLVDFYFLNKSKSRGKMVGVIIYKNNVVQRKGDGDRIWSNLKSKSKLYVRDIIRADSLSEAEIKLIDGTSIKIEENSMFRLDITGEKAQLEFERGSIRIEQPGMKDSHLEISAAGKKVELVRSTAKLSGTKVSLYDTIGKIDYTYGSKDTEANKEKSKSGKKDALSFFKSLKENFDLKLFVEKGKAKVTGSSNEKQIEVGRYQSLSLSENKMKVQTVPVILTEPKDQENLNLGLFSSKGKAKVVFKWNSENKNKERLEISQSRNFNNILISAVVASKNESKSKTLFLEEGTYYWRVVNEDKNDKDSIAKSLVYKFSIQAMEVLKILSPLPNSELVETYTDVAPKINFSWSHSREMVTYKFIIAQSSDFLKEQKTFLIENSTNYTLQLPEGGYYWQVSYLSPVSKKIIKSELGSLKVKRLVSKNIVPDVVAVSKNLENQDTSQDNSQNEKVNILPLPLNEEMPISIEDVEEGVKNFEILQFKKYIKNLRYSCANNLYIPDVLILGCFPTHITVNLKGWFRNYLYHYLLLERDNYKDRAEAYNFFQEHCDFKPSYLLARSYLLSKFQKTSIEIDKIKNLIRKYEGCKKK